MRSLTSTSAKEFLPHPEETLDLSGPHSQPPLWWKLLRVVVRMLSVPVVVITRARWLLVGQKGSLVIAEAKTCLWDWFGETMEKDIGSISKKL